MFLLSRPAIPGACERGAPNYRYNNTDTDTNENTDTNERRMSNVQLITPS